MSVTKARRDKEDYQDYWKVTLEYTDTDSNFYIGTLKIIKDFIDKHKDELSEPETYSEDLWKKLQEEVDSFHPKQRTVPDAISPSVRKAINQFVKLGFVEPGGKGYHRDLEKFLQPDSPQQKLIIFSKIVYENSNFNGSWTTPDSKDRGNHMQFLIKTLQEVNRLTRQDILGLMKVDIDTITDDHLTRKELDEYVDDNWDDGFLEKKYNQLSHFRSILKRLDGMTMRTEYPEGDVLISETYAKEQFPDHWRKEGRDPYLQNMYRRSLIQESIDKTQAEIDVYSTNGFCMASGMNDKCIASHLKPFSRCDNSEEAYDPSNGLFLLVKIDKYFDKGRITFDSNGCIIFRRDFPPAEKKEFEKLSINTIFLTKERLQYLEYHRKNVFVR
tara:strand:+ start:181 stop:1338 length:1158 start_codon:yes stop_codon:yes gene_type:complete